MNRISTRTLSLLSVLSLAVVMTVSGLGLTANAQDKLSKTQLNTLIATAKTPAEHQRIADYYQAQAKNYLAQADEHQAMIAAYKANPSTKHQASAVTHCENFVTSLNDLAAKSQEMAKMHQQMAIEAGAQK
jgi:sensor histidine kinase regulating citrate/malate metabolism